MVWQGPVSARCSRDGKICCYRDAFEYDFLAWLLLCLASYFSFFFSFFSYFFPPCRYVLSSSCPFVCATAICYSPQVCIYSTCYFCLCHLYPTHLGILLFFYSFSIFFVALISHPVCGVFVLLCSRTRYASTWFAYFDSTATFGFSLFRCDHRICISLGWRIRKDTGCTADVVE